MAYICQDCGVVKRDSSSICNPINEEYKHKSCSTGTAEVCDENASEMKYSCGCGNVSANPLHLCNPTPMEY